MDNMNNKNEIAIAMHQAQDFLNFAKFKLPLCVSAILVPAMQLFEKYIFNDWEFIGFLIVLIALDTITGVWKHYKLNTVSSQGFGRFMVKVIVYGIFLIVVHVLGNFSDKPLVEEIFSWVDTLCYGAIVVRESISIIENLGAIQPGLIPVWVLKKLKQFDNEGKFEEHQNQEK